MRKSHSSLSTAFAVGAGLLVIATGLFFRLTRPALAQTEPDQGDQNLYLPLVSPNTEDAYGRPERTPTPLPPGRTPLPPPPGPLPTMTPSPGLLPDPVVFVSRQIPNVGSVYWDDTGSMPGVGAFARFQVAAPGKLQVLEPSGRVRTLVDGSAPSFASLHLIDVNAPDVSWDGSEIVFAGYPAGDDAKWRIYAIRADGSGLRQVTGEDPSAGDPGWSRFEGFRNQGFNDTDPAWLPDGRIVFTSTRYPSFGQYSGVRTTNLYIVNADGSDLHRITSERNGADRPVVDPATGKIVFSRWWRNHRLPTDDFATVTDPAGGYVQHSGLTTDPNDTSGRPAHMTRNSWQLGEINPDGTELVMFSGLYRDIDATHAYGGAFAPDGAFIGNYFPMYNMTEAAGFGGLRRYPRGAGSYEPLVGITDQTLDYANANPPSYGIFIGSYAGEPDVLPDGRIVFSWAPDRYQDYGLYIMDADAGNWTLLYNAPGTTELRIQLLAPRPLPPVRADTVTTRMGPVPPTAEGPYAADGTFTFDALNVYFNGPVDLPIANAPAVGSAQTLRFFIDHQRSSPGSFANLDWPILLGELPVAADGSVRNGNAPAGVPLFEQLRDAAGAVPLTFAPAQGGGGHGGALRIDGAAQVAGMNYGAPGEIQRCVGCHAGHSLLPIPASAEAAQWTNLAPGAQVRVSSTRAADENRGLVDRRVMTGSVNRYWSSAPGQSTGQWVELVFPVPVTVRTVRLYNPRPDEASGSDLVVQQATVRLYADDGGAEVASAEVGPLAVDGTEAAFADVRARVVRVELGSVQGRFSGRPAAALAEIEVIARGEAAQ